MAGETKAAVQKIAPAGMAPPGGHYSYATVANGFVFVSGLLPVTPDGSRLADAAFDVQAAQVLANLHTTLAAAGSGIDRLVQVRVYIDSVENWPAFNTLYAKWAGDARPARAVVPAGPLHFGFKLEVEAVALV